jgi:eukaryotic-like serine/threonine-protein kinase
MACSREFKGSIGTCPHDGNALVALPADQWLDKRLAGKYVIKQKLGTGGMGEVYLAWHELMQTWVAIKFLKSSFVEDAKAVQRFQQEAMAAKRLKHANVITLYDFDLAPTGQPYMVMEYLVGHDKDHPAISMAQLIKQKHANGGNLPIETITHIIAQACDALDHAHRQGVIHRDIKPANIMIVPNDQDPLFVKVVDFGVAKTAAH